MEDKELRERLSRIEAHLGMEPYDAGGIQEKKEQTPVNVQTVKIDRIGELLMFIEEKRQETTEEAFLGYLKKMEDVLCREQVKLDDYADNLYRNYEIYKKRHEAESVRADVKVSTPLQEDSDRPETIEPAAESAEAIEELTETVEVAEPVKDEAPESKTEAVPIMSQQYTYSKPAKKADMEFGIGAVVLSIIGALFIIAALVIFGLNFMDNLQQGIFFYVLAGVVIAFSELVLRKHLERFAQAVTGIGVCVLYTATILNYLYLHTINSLVAILITLAVSMFALLLSRKRDSSSLRIIGILGCYISFMPLEKFASLTEFVIPCVMLLIVNVLYILLPIRSDNKAVRNVHAISNVVAVSYLMGTAWASDLSYEWVFAFVAAMVVVHYAIYYKTAIEKSALACHVIANVVLHLLLTIIAWDEKFYLAAIALFVIDGLAIWIYREKGCKWLPLYCYSGFLLLTSSSLRVEECLIATAILLAVYKLLAWKEDDLAVSNVVMTIISALVLFSYLQDESGMQYLLLGVFVLAVATIKQMRSFHEVATLVVLWYFAVMGFDQISICFPLAFLLVFMCFMLFTRVDYYRDENEKPMVVATWIINGFSLFGLFMNSGELHKVAMVIILLVESALLMLLFSEKSGTKEEKVLRNRTFALALFFTYMIFVFDFELPIVASILLMLVAIASVGAGFYFKEKSVRVYGLCMSLFVCGKILLVDMSKAQTADKVIAFFVVGVIALAISYLYMRIERSLAQKENL